MGREYFGNDMAVDPRTSSPAVAAFLRPFGSKRPAVERPTRGRLPVAFPLPGEGQGSRGEQLLPEKNSCANCYIVAYSFP